VQVIVSTIFATEKNIEISTPDSSTKFIAAPWISANSDEGIAVGFTAGISRFPDLLIYSSIQTSTKGYSSLSLRGEMGKNRVRNVWNTNLSNVIRYSYYPSIDKPETRAKASVTRYQMRYSRLYMMDDRIELGPDFTLDYSIGKDVEYTGDGLYLSAVDGPYDVRFGESGLSTLGIRARYASMNPNRPLSGNLVDLSFRLGNSGDNFPDSRNGELRIAFAKPITMKSRIYLRLLGQYQGSAKPPVQKHLGGETTLRGEPSQRDYGRTVISSRVQYHKTLLDKWDLPLRLANRICSLFPVWKMEVEGVCFYDIGSVERISGKFLKTRQGYGVGLRFVIPPELVLFFDIAKSPHSSPRFYLGVGETL